ncbi:MAG: Rne/Rng family ribonuclease [Desulfatibacillaceae bacterium]|nr:Rne/Rng family ribonuclease [Desulfatibacillaceae bacterium]
MIKELIINDAGYETRVALLEDSVLSELYIERCGEAGLVTNVYKGKVLRVLPGMQAAFVDIGLDQAAFIYVDDVVPGFPLAWPPPDFFSDFQEEGADSGDDSERDSDIALDPDGDDPAYTQKAAPASRRNRQPIEDMLQEGQEILVQVAKAPIGNKGARVTSRISIPGRFLVLMPTSAHVGISRRIEDTDERTRLKEGISSIRSGPYGYIARTVCEGVDMEKVAHEERFLNKLWSRIEQRYRQAAAPKLLYRELSAGLKAVRDLFTKEVDRVVVDSQGGYQEILEFVESFEPGLADSVVHYDVQEPIFDAYHLEGEISRLLNKKVWLKSGGHIVIDETEALTTVDVNTGRYVGKAELSETILKTNLEAVKEIAYQLRLRDIGGIIVIDFIDMERQEDREKVHRTLTEALVRDRSNTNVLPMSELGLIEMTRKRTRENIRKLLTEPCCACDGNGRVLSKKSICHRIYREIIRLSHDMSGDRISLKVHPELARFLLEEENTSVLSLEDRTGREILIVASPGMEMERFDIVETFRRY